MNDHTLIIDQGGHSTRAIVFNNKGKPVASASEPVGDTLLNENGFVEYKAEPIIASTFSLLDKLAEQLKSEEIQKVQTAGIICQRSSIIVCDKTNGKAIGPMISWQDTRNNQWLTGQGLDLDSLQAFTGLRFNAHAGASKMRWLIDNDQTLKPDLANKQIVFAPWGAYFTSQLCRQKTIKTDPILAARTGLTELGQTTWSNKLLSLFGIPQDCLPEAVPSLHHFGNITLGGKVIPVNLLGGDQNFIPYAYGSELLTQAAFLNIGTGAFILGFLSGPLSNTLPSSSPNSLPSPLLKTASGIKHNCTPDIFLEGTINGAANVLDWWQSQLPKPYSFEELDELLSLECEAPIFLNTLYGTGSPYWIASREPEFIDNSQTETSTAQKTKAVLESIIFAIANNFLEIARHNKHIQYIVISGGLSAMDSLCQNLANLLQLKIYRYKDTEASARGACFFMEEIIDYRPKEEPETFSPQETSDTMKGRFDKACKLSNGYKLKT